MNRHPRSRAEQARQIQKLLIESSSLIESYTGEVCPRCTDRCCKQRHGTFTPLDQAYVNALGKDVPRHDPARPIDGPCQFLSERGCTKPRWQRAWKCTWYFCDALLQALADGPQRQARALSRMQAESQRLYEQLQGGDDD